MPNFGELLHRFGPEIQERQLHIASTCPDISGGGWDIDFGSSALRFRQSGRSVPVQVVGSESRGTWMWAHSMPGLPENLFQASVQVLDWGTKQGIQALAVGGFNLPEWQPGQLLSGMSCSVIAAGLLNAPGVFCCYDRQNDRRLWVLMFDESLREQAELDPITRVALRFPKIWAMAGAHPHEGGITLVDWVLALDGYCRSYGIDGEMTDEATVKLEHGGKRAQARFSEGELTIEATL